MNFTQERPDRVIDPRELTTSQLAALATCRDYRLRRVKGGWQCPGSPKVTLATAAILGMKRLTIVRHYNGQQRLEVTGSGRMTLGVAEQRKQRA